MKETHLTNITRSPTKKKRKKKKRKNISEVHLLPFHHHHNLIVNGAGEKETMKQWLHDERENVLNLLAFINQLFLTFLILILPYISY